VAILAWMALAIPATIDFRIPREMGTGQVVAYYLGAPLQLVRVLVHTVTNSAMLNSYAESFLGVFFDQPLTHRAYTWLTSLLALAISFTGALTTSLATGQAVVEAAHLNVTINQVDSLVLATILGVEALLGAVAVVGMSSRSRQRELAVLRCAGSTVRGVRRQVVIEAALYVGTALLISLLPLVVTTAGESLFYARAGMPLVVRPGVGPVLLVALLSFLALVAVLLAPIRGATRTPIGAVLAAE